MIRRTHRAVTATLFFLLIVLSGCGSSPPVKYFTLSPALPPGTAAPELVVKIGPIEFPGSLDRSQIVTRLSGTQLEVDEFNVWSAPLEDQFLRVLGDNMGTAMGTPTVVVYPNEIGVPLDYQVLLDVIQFDGALGGTVILRARWAIAGRDGSVLESGMFSDTRGAEDNTYDSLVAAHSELIALLASALVSSIDRLSTDRGE